MIGRVTKLLFEVGSILVGLGGVVYQLRWADKPDAAVLAVLAAIAAAPMATNFRALYPGSAGTTGSTPGSSSPPPPLSPEPDSSPQSSSPM